MKPPIRKHSLHAAALEALKDGPLTIEQIAERLEVTPKQISNNMKSWRDKGTVVREGDYPRFTYRLPTLSPVVLSCGRCGVAHVEADKAIAEGWQLNPTNQYCPEHRGEAPVPDVIDRLIDGVHVASLTTADMDAAWRWVEDPRVGMPQHLRRLITLLLVALRKTARVDVCEACGVCLEPASRRCNDHVLTEPGDPEWTEDEP